MHVDNEVHNVAKKSGMVVEINLANCILLLNAMHKDVIKTNIAPALIEHMFLWRR